MARQRCARASGAVPRLQFTVEADTVLSRPEGSGRRSSAFRRSVVSRLRSATSDRKRPDVVPKVVADLLGLEVTPNRSTLISVLKRPSSTS